MKKNPAHWDAVSKDYDVTELVGMGSHGHVVRAIHRGTGKQVALKYIWNIFSGNYPTKKAIREIAILKHASSLEGKRFVCQLHEVITPPDFEKDSYVFMVLEYMPLDLKAVLDNAKNINFPEAAMLKLLYNLLCCLHFLHSANILHRDIKPANILVDENLQVKICDFGLSRTDPTPLPLYPTPKTRVSRFKMA
mmetsp:Transcript_12825/g.19856  ORF Transcript_12825/g.19856 Transcript_12825/m.19856 type:complete len:193 (+) Transcript_12825:174-752(+)|eukprot:CAMPEP_0170501940 /NCGR_PEP_ID=MMETSP0208-20121228/39917_1 /TAXON_ID=197538 /ORGANISM="Strombidium inclinatum, Strain S3" /LENGTH=192 /DNA_ID=CAMNT_0010780739 /DNA_START=106 /DNA_END=684 /DNA_ORIENTATION=+